MSSKTQRVIAPVALLAVASAVVAGFLIVGSPSEVRRRKIDDSRLSDLWEIQNSVRWMVIEVAEGGKIKLKRPLPKTLEEVAKYREPIGVYHGLDLNDPETGKPYRYKITGETQFQLCATFATSRDEKSRTFWNHPAGQHCFLFDVTSTDDNVIHP